MGAYCRACGEKRRETHDYSLRHYFGETIELVTHLDSKVVRSVGWLVARPGFLSAEYFKGRRIRYVAPLRFFFALSVVYYLSNSIFPYNAFTTPLDFQLHRNDYYPAYAEARVNAVMRERQLSYGALEQEYDHKTGVLSKTLVFTLIPVIALLFYALLFRKRKYFAEHLVVATHFWSFALLAIGVFIPIVLLLLTKVGTAIGISAATLASDSVPTLLLQGIFAVYLFVMFRRAYETSAWYAALLAASISWSFFHILWLFRFFLFETTLRLL